MRVTPDCDSINSFDICAVTGVQVYPDVAFDGTNYMAVWSDLRIAANSTVYASRVTQSGVVLDPAGIQVGPANGTMQKEPSIEFIGDKYFVVWGHYIPPFGVTGRFINLDGTLGDTVHIATAASKVQNTLLAYDGNKIFVVWAENPSLLRGQLVSTTGTLIGSPFTIADDAFVVRSGSICFSGSEYFLTYSRWAVSILELWGCKYDTSGIPMLPEFRIAEPTYSCADGYAVAGDEHYLCVWSRSPYPSDIYGNLDVNVGIEHDTNVSPDDKPLIASVLNGPLTLPASETCKVFDIAGREVSVFDLAPGIYFISVEGKVVQKVIKLR